MAMAGVVIVGMLLRMPIGFSMLMSGVAYLWVKGQDLGLVAEQVSNGLYNSYVLLAVPMFVFAANLMNAGTVSERIFDFCRVLVGRMRGGLAQVDILVSVVFSGMSGSAIADAAGQRRNACQPAAAVGLRQGFHHDCIFSHFLDHHFHPSSFQPACGYKLV